MAPKKRTIRASPATTTTTTTPITNAQLKALIDQGVADAFAARDVDRSMNGDDNHNSRTGVRRQAPLSRECTYPDFMKCKPLYFKGTEGVVELNQSFERMETMFCISNCIVENEIKFAICTLLGSALTWWNAHIKKLEVEMWNLKVKGADVVGYNQCFQELALMCARMFQEESDKIEKYVGGLPDMIHRSVMASKPKIMQDAIEFATKLMDKKIITLAERVAIAYTAGSGKRKEYARTLPLRNKSPAATNNQRKLTCYECGNQGHYKSDCLELKNCVRNITPTGSTILRLQEVEDLQEDDLLYYNAEMELMNMILLSIPNEIYNSVDSCKTAKEMWARVERLMRGTIQNQVNKEMRLTNEFDQFIAEPGTSLISVYNRFSQLMNDLERNNMKFPTVSVNTKFLNSLKPEWLKYMTQVRLAKQLTVDSFDDLFDYLSQFEKLVNSSRAKKLEKSHDPLALVAHTGSSSRNTSSYYVTHASSVVDYDEEYEQDDVHNHSEDPLASAMLHGHHTSGISACALRNFDLEVMELDISQNNALAKLPMLKLGEYEMWEIRIKQLQRLVSRLAILGVVTPPEDLNVNFLRSLPSEWDTHVKVKKSAGASNDDKNLAFLTTSGASSTNNINTVTPEVSTATTKVNTASTEISTASFSDATVYAFLSTQPQGSQLVHEDLEQLHDDDLEEMDLKWNMALLSMRARKFYQRTGRKIIIDGSNTAGYDKSKVECFNCHKMGHFARECRAPRSKDNRNWNQGSSSKAVKIEDAFEKAMCAIDGAGFDWSDMAEEEIQANMALMAFSDSEVTNDKSCSKSCLKNYEALKKQYDDLLVKLDDTDFKAATYKRGHKEYQMGLLREELEKIKLEKEVFEFKIAKFEKSAKDLDQLLASQITDKSKKGFSYNVVPSPHPLILNRPTPLDLSYSGLEEFKEPEVNEYGPRDSSLKPTTGCDKESDNSKENTNDSLKQQQKTATETSSVKSPLKVDKDWKEKFFYPANHVREEEPKKARENTDAPIIEDWVSDDEDEVEPIPKVEKKTAIPTATKKESVKLEKPVRRSVRYAEMYRSQRPRGNQRNWNGQKSNQLGCNFVFNNKACFNCGSFDHIQYSCPNQHMVPRAVLMKTGLKTVNTARPVRSTVNTVRARGFNAVKPSACWVWRPIKPNGASLVFNKYNYIDARGRSKSISKTLMEVMLLLVEEHIEAELLAKMCDKKNYVLFTVLSECLVYSNFKLTDENQYFIKFLEQDNMEKGIKREYSVARTPQQNGVAERKNRTLIEAARTMLADSKLPTTFWAEAVSTACYVQNRVLIVKPHNKTPYELFRGFKPAIGFMKPFGCHVTILNTLDNLGKFDGKSDEGFFVGYSLSSKAFRVYNTRTRKVQENLHIGFLENKPMIEGNGPKWLFDLDSLTQSMNYVPVVAGTFSNDFAGIQGVSESSTSSQQDQDNQDCIVMPIWKDASYFGDVAPRTDADDGLQDENDATEKSHDDSSLKDNEKVSTALPEVNTATPEDLVGPSPASEDTQVEDQEIELGNIPQSYAIPTTPTNAIFEGKVSSGSSQCLLLVSSLKKNQKEFKALSDQRYFKGKPSLGLWYSKDSPLELVAYTDSDYAGSCKDRKLLLPLMVTLRIFTEASLRRHLKLDDHDGITSIPNSEIFES
ncbi:ribonuclease H-like domain-containing protein [Tanacetum coccineum]